MLLILIRHITFILLMNLLLLAKAYRLPEKIAGHHALKRWRGRERYKGSAACASRDFTLASLHKFRRRTAEEKENEQDYE